jgi:putative FmdB family regulatory protein
MPLYEYYCSDCKDTFEQLRPAQQADSPADCPACRSMASQRILSLFASSVKTAGSDAAYQLPVGGGCCGGGCGCHVH